jgi:hypothetical protein
MRAECSPSPFCLCSLLSLHIGRPFQPPHKGAACARSAVFSFGKKYFPLSKTHNVCAVRRPTLWERLFYALWRRKRKECLRHRYKFRRHSTAPVFCGHASSPQPKRRHYNPLVKGITSAKAPLTKGLQKTQRFFCLCGFCAQNPCFSVGSPRRYS